MTAFTTFNLTGLEAFDEVWLVDVEYSAKQGCRPVPICLVAQEAFAGLLRRVPDMVLPEKDTPSWRRSFTLRGLTKLPVRWN